MSPFVAVNSISSPAWTLSMSAISGGIVSLSEPPILTTVLLRAIGMNAHVAVRYT